MRIDARRGQAFVETAIGLFALVFILAALLTFGRIIPDAQRYRAMARWKAGYNAQHADAPFDTAMNGTVWNVACGLAGAAGDALPALPGTPSPSAEAFSYEVDVRGDVGAFAADEVFGVDKFRVTAEVYLPGMSIPCAGRDMP